MLGTRLVAPLAALSGAAEAPTATLRGLNLPRLITADDVCALTRLPSEQLDWYADRRRMNRSARDPRLKHYDYRWIRKRSGACRLLEMPKPRLKRAQRRLVDELLRHLPLHAACHGHRVGHSVKTFVAPHAGTTVVVAFDLAEFFSTVSEARVRAIFAAFGYSDAIAPLLAALCCTPTPGDSRLVAALLCERRLTPAIVCPSPTARPAPRCGAQ